VLNFGPYRLDLGNEQLWRDTQLVRLTPKTFQVLRAVIGTPGQLVTKEELFSGGVARHGGQRCGAGVMHSRTAAGVGG
jgi:DNA-binding response OmpR family regulator